MNHPLENMLERFQGQNFILRKLLHLLELSNFGKPLATGSICFDQWTVDGRDSVPVLGGGFWKHCVSTFPLVLLPLGVKISLEGDTL